MKVLIVGLGSIARKHLAALEQIDGGRHDIYALRSSEEYAEIPGVISITSLEQIGDITPDFAIISNPTSAHAKALRLLAELEVPVMIEKPVFEQAVYDDIVVDYASRGTLTYVACNLRFLGCVQYMKELVESGNHVINEVNVYCGSSLPSWRPGSDWRRCYSANAAMGGGVHLDLIHELDYVTWIFGMPENVRTTLRSQSTLEIDAVDYANYCMTYPRFCASVILNYYRPRYSRTFEIVTDTDIFTADLAANQVTDMSGQTVYSGGGSTIADTYLAQMQYFTDLVKNGARESMNPLATAYELLKYSTK